MPAIKFRNQDGEQVGVNLHYVTWWKSVKVGVSLQVTLATMDGQKFTTIMTPDSLMSLEKILGTKSYV